MTAFSTLVLLAINQAEADVVGSVKALLDPYDTRMPVEKYEKDCECIGKIALQAAMKAADERFGSSCFLLSRFNEEVPNGTDDQWCEFITPYFQYKKQVFEAHPEKNKPDPTCGFYTQDFCPEGHEVGERVENGRGCGGTGKYMAALNPQANFYAARIAGLANFSWSINPGTDLRDSQVCQLCCGSGKRQEAEQFGPEGMEQPDTCDGCAGTGKWIQPVCSILDIPNNDWIPVAVVTPDGEWHEQDKKDGSTMLSETVADWVQHVRALLEKHREAVAVVVACARRHKAQRSEADPQFEFFKNWPKHIVRNADNHDLEPLLGGPFLIGRVDEVNGGGATEVPEFNPTRHELLQLVSYWWKRALESEFWVFLTRQVGSEDLRVRPFAWRRIDRVAALLGEKEVEKVLNQAESEFGETQDPRAWEVFLHGTKEEREQLQDEFQRQLTETDDSEAISQKRGADETDKQ